MAIHVVFPAAGVGKRFGAPIPKQHTQINGKTVLEWTLSAWQDVGIDGYRVLVVSEEDSVSKKIAESFGDIQVTFGSAERSGSVLNALHFLGHRASPDDWVLVHDIARPCVSLDDIKSLIRICQESQIGGILARPITDTIKQNHPDHKVNTIDRSNIWAAQTPQCFRLGELTKSLSSALDSGIEITDEASAIEAAGLQVNLVEGSSRNIKLTQPSDALLIEFYLNLQSR